jgi:Fe-S-cluster containining protein
MEMLSLDLKKYGLKHLEATQIKDYSNEDIEKLVNAYSKELIAPRIPWILFNSDSVKWLLSLSKCRQCGKCCRENKEVPDNPGIIVSESDLERISKNSKHSLKYLRKVAQVNMNPVYKTRAKYLPLPCMFYILQSRRCKIYFYRPGICSLYPVSNSPKGDVTVDVQCEFGKEIFKKALKSARDTGKHAQSQL